MKYQELREQICDVCHKMWQLGWVAANDGNVSVKLPDGNFMATPTGISKSFITPDKLVIINENGEVIFKKYSPIGDMGQFAEEYCATLQTVSGFPCAITDKEMVIAASGKTRAMGKALSAEFEEIIESRRPFDAKDRTLGLTKNGEDAEVALAHPIMAEGDIVGMVTMLRSPGKQVGVTEDKLLHAAAIFLGKQLES